MTKMTPSQVLRLERLTLDPTCRRCGVTKTVADFPRRAVDYSCSECRKIIARDRYRKLVATATPEELAAYRKRVNARQNRNRAERMAQMSPEQLAAWKAEVNRGNTDRRYAVRDEVYRAYGGYRCACCGETEKAFLSIDHVNNDGAKHKRECRLHTGEQLYRWLKRNGFPEGFQVLCMNCQWGKRNNNGVCPHKERCNDYPSGE